jgi:hypothetical protein
MYCFWVRSVSLCTNPAPGLPAEAVTASNLAEDSPHKHLFAALERNTILKKVHLGNARPMMIAVWFHVGMKEEAEEEAEAAEHA